MKTSHSIDRRRGVTLIEVIFSIGVILVGLIGVASILPLAGRRSQDAVSMSVGAAIADSVMNELQAKRYVSGDALVRPPLNTPPPNDYVAFGRSTMATVGSSFCIDPMFMAEYASTNAAPLNEPVSGHSRLFFPYYKSDFDPTRDPSAATAVGTNWPNAQPRMLRVGVLRPGFTPVTSASIEECLAIVESIDDLNVERPKDRSKNAVLKAANATTAGTSFGKRLATGEYSWIATVNPFADNAYASVSVAVIRNRDRNFVVTTAPVAANRPDLNMIAERIAYVTYESGFKGGAGGVIHLIGNANTVSTIRTGEWIMLSRRVSSAPVVDFHRWYRVSGVDGKAILRPRDPTVSTTAGSLRSELPATGNRDVWERKLYLDGPDWDFGFEATPVALPAGYSDGTFGNNTYVTIVEGVVSVTERTVSLNSL